MGKNKIVRTEFDRNGYLLYRLVQVAGTGKQTTITVFGYSVRNNLWVRILGLNEPVMTLIPEIASDVKEVIASWTR